jgi:coenzyme PQQ biosynthesis protein PqqD
MTALPDAAVVRLLRGVRMHWDRVRGTWVLLAPERVLKLDPVGQAILERIDGARPFGALVDDLAETYSAPRERIAEDAGRFLGALIERRMAEVRP